MNSSLPTHLYQSTNELALNNLTNDLDKICAHHDFLLLPFNLTNWLVARVKMVDPHKLACATSTEPVTKMLAANLVALLEGSRIR